VNPFLSEDFKDNITNVMQSIKDQSSLLKVYPNPFTTALAINFQGKDNSGAVVHIYNSRGQKVKTLVSNSAAGKNESLRWDGTDFSGKQVNAGPYLIQLLSDKKTETTQVLFLGR
jgi:flagellar hook assembly protein FlgD